MATSTSTSVDDSRTSGEYVATVFEYGAGPYVVGRVVLADSAARPDADIAHLLRDALDALRAADAQVTYLTTPAGFLKAEMPASWSGKAGWSTEQADFNDLVPHVQQMALELVGQSGAESGPARYLSLGIDLKAPSGKVHVETSVLYDTRSNEITGLTGKSYPTTGQQDALVRNPLSTNHVVDVASDRALTLVCHDLSVFNPRGRAVRRGLRDRVGDEMERHIRSRKPTIALHQAHTVEGPATWTAAWNALRRQNEDSLGAWTTAFRYLGFNGVRPKKPLSRTVLDRTRGGDLPAIDVVLASPETIRRLT